MTSSTGFKSSQNNLKVNNTSENDAESEDSDLEGYATPNEEFETGNSDEEVKVSSFSFTFSRDSQPNTIRKH